MLQYYSYLCASFLHDPYDVPRRNIMNVIYDWWSLRYRIAGCASVKVKGYYYGGWIDNRTFKTLLVFRIFQRH